MGVQESSENYVSLSSYANEKSIPMPLLRGAIFGLDLNLPEVSGVVIVQPDTRKILDPVCDRIYAKIGPPGRRSGRRPKSVLPA